MDLTGDSVTEDALVQGYTAHDAAGNAVDGANPYEKAATDAEVLTQEQLLDEIVEELAKRCVVTEPLLQARTVTPTEEVQVVTPDAGYDGLSSVTVEAAQGGEGTYGWKKCVSKLPSGYTEREYIQSSGTQYINTGLTANGNTCVEIDFSFNNAGAPFGCWDSGSTNKFIPLFGVGGKVYVSYGTQQKQVAGSWYDRTFVKFDKNVFSVNGGAIATFNYESFQSTNTMYLFAWNNAGSVANHATMYLYSCKIYDNGTLVRDFVPCTNASGTAGLYDLVNSQFYGNAGSGTLTAGPAASKLSAITVVAYAVSDDADAYPDGAFLDGYYYEKLAA